MMNLLEKLKSLLGVDGSEKDILLQFALDRAEDTICNYCRISDVPEGLETVWLSMAMDFYRTEGYGNEAVPSEVKSITEGDVSVSFGSMASATENAAVSWIKSYEPQLRRYRKAGW